MYVQNLKYNSGSTYMDAATLPSLFMVKRGACLDLLNNQFKIDLFEFSFCLFTRFTFLKKQKLMYTQHQNY